MSDLIERLRVVGGVGDEAADLIEQQQVRIMEIEATVERLRDYIERYSPHSTDPSKCERRIILAATPRQHSRA